ncbi:HAD family hydrolase [Streptomyces sp. NPDC088733]|uniref:HAD family hydrolase n=1 Tax=Streptomyces sp. NPDC088733 TaxID=3365880 RepID=UPI00381C55BB
MGVLFDFDGPLCHLFATTTARFVAGELWNFIEESGLPPVDSVPPEKHDSPLDVLKGAAADWTDLKAVGSLEGELARLELQAVEGARETDGAEKLVRALWRERIPMAITTNNSESAVERHLENCGMVDAFQGRIHGRQSVRPGFPLRVKPDPDCIERALVGIGQVDRRNILMIGDSPDDVAAAESAGIRFLGFQNPDGNTGLQDAYPNLRPIRRLGDLTRGLA